MAQWRDEARPPGRAVVVDIDGVLSDASGRQHFLHNDGGVRDWRGFFGAVGDDPPLPATRALLELLPDSVIVVLLSARPNWVFERTVEWLERHAIRWDLLIMRGDGSMSAASTFKRDVVQQLISQGFVVQFAFDDDLHTVEMYLAEGIPAMYVHSGYYGDQRTS
jgi:hypothetical protein